MNEDSSASGYREHRVLERRPRLDSQSGTQTSLATVVRMAGVRTLGRYGLKRGIKRGDYHAV